MGRGMEKIHAQRERERERERELPECTYYGIVPFAATTTWREHNHFQNSIGIKHMLIEEPVVVAVVVAPLHPNNTNNNTSSSSCSSSTIYMKGVSRWFMRRYTLCEYMRFLLFVGSLSIRLFSPCIMVMEAII